jgi:hypothetical protein
VSGGCPPALPWARPGTGRLKVLPLVAGGAQRLEQGGHAVDQLLDHTVIVIRPVPGRRI